jgi:hypothetical protein
VEFGSISGVGKQKLAEFSEIFLAEIAAHLRENAKKTFASV